MTIGQPLPYAELACIRGRGALTDHLRKTVMALETTRRLSTRGIRFAPGREGPDRPAGRFVDWRGEAPAGSPGLP